MNCEYGCGKEALFLLKNNKWCCSSSYSGCSSVKEKITQKIECPKCLKQISKNCLKNHLLSCHKYKCLYCGAVLDCKKKFCNSSCAAFYNNKNSINLQNCTRGPISKKSIGSGFCLFCGKTLKNKVNRYCNNTCRGKFHFKNKVNDWLSGKISGNCQSGAAFFVKQYLLEKYNNKCTRCGWSEKNIFTGNVPLEIEHIDGNAYNNDLSNLDLICPNCQSLTKTYRGANRGNGRREYLKKYYLRTPDGKII